MDKKYIKKILNPHIIIKASNLMKIHPRYGIAEKVVTKIFVENPNNNKLQNVLPKITILNALYSTSILNVIEYAEYIVTIKKLDKLLVEGNNHAVDQIRLGHNIRNKKSNKEYNFYSFATKYCSFHNKKNFVIYDDILSKLLYEINKFVNIDDKLKKVYFRDYDYYKNFITELLIKIDKKINFKTFDMALWIIGKYLFKIEEQKYLKWYKNNVGILFTS